VIEFHAPAQHPASLPDEHAVAGQKEEREHEHEEAPGGAPVQNHRNTCPAVAWREGNQLASRVWYWCEILRTTFRVSE